MTGTKRASPECDLSTRLSKVAKHSASQSTKKASRKGGKRGTKPSIPAETFKSTASPLHIYLTYTPPGNAEEIEVDPGSIANVILAPNTFSTGSFGWKGSKRVTVELPSSNGDETEQVQVMLTINATVVGSRPGETKDAAEECSSESKEDQ